MKIGLGLDVVMNSSIGGIGSLYRYSIPHLLSTASDSLLVQWKELGKLNTFHYKVDYGRRIVINPICFYPNDY
jgi:hypothetical protein